MPADAAPAAQQYTCVNCTETKFYVMLQPDGSIEAFCVRSNHRQILINLPKLVEAIYRQDKEYDPELRDSAMRQGDPSYNS